MCPDVTQLYSEHEAEESEAPFINNTPALRKAIVTAFKKIVDCEDEIAASRADIKATIGGLVLRGLNKKAIQIALARRKLAMDEELSLSQIDESLAIICGISSLGIQGDLFSDAGNGEAL